MMPRRDSLGRRAFTLVEIMLALGLLSLLMIAVVNLLDTSLEIWDRTESQRDLVEVGSSAVDLLARDLSSIEPGPRGDLLSEWTMWDTDRDNVAGLSCVRLRMVRRPSLAELHRLGAPEDADLVEVCWALLPDRSAPEKEARSVGVLYRGERWVGDDASLSFFDDGFFNAAGKAPAGTLNLVTGGVLWAQFSFATQTSIVNDGWSFGDELEDCSTSWDAWNRARPDLELCALNAAASGMPEAKDLPLMPRRIRIELEIERPVELKRRTRLAHAAETELPSIRVEDPDRLPEPGAMILVEEEWMEILSISGQNVSVKRGQRGTRKTNHDPGVVIHHGWRISRAIPIPLYREDWNL